MPLLAEPPAEVAQRRDGGLTVARTRGRMRRASSKRPLSSGDPFLAQDPGSAICGPSMTPRIRQPVGSAASAATQAAVSSLSGTLVPLAAPIAQRAGRRAGDPAVLVRRLVAELGVLGVELAVAFRADAWPIGPDAVPARLEVGWEARAKPPVAPPPLLSQMRLLVRPARPPAAAPIDGWQAGPGGYAVTAARASRWRLRGALESLHSAQL
jgi:hypothetical protein